MILTQIRNCTTPCQQCMYMCSSCTHYQSQDYFDKVSTNCNNPIAFSRRFRSGSLQNLTNDKISRNFRNHWFVKILRQNNCRLEFYHFKINWKKINLRLLLIRAAARTAQCVSLIVLYCVLPLIWRTLGQKVHIDTHKSEIEYAAKHTVFSYNNIVHDANTMPPICCPQDWSPPRGRLDHLKGGLSPQHQAIQ
jgi:hypothetical protein